MDDDLHVTGQMTDETGGKRVAASIYYSHEVGYDVGFAICLIIKISVSDCFQHV